MDATRFDALARSLIAAGSRRRVLAIVLSGLLAIDTVRADAKNRNKKRKKVTLCHEGQTITVGKKAKKQHLKHGDMLGACPPPPPPGCPVGQVACGADCIPAGACCTSLDCPVGTFCQHGGCFTGCMGATPANCVTTTDCDLSLCMTTVAGPNVCIAGSGFCPSVPPCGTDSDCPFGQTCVQSGCCTFFEKPRFCAAANMES